MAAHMTQQTTAAAAEVAEPWIPEDTFRNRLGLVRVALGGLNIKEAAELCGLNPENWRRWEDGAGSPRDLEGVCRKIADATGLDYRWLIAGGGLRTGSLASGLEALPEPTGQGSLFAEDDEPEDFWSRPFLTSV
jgi:hypothetical protein